ncbi:uncharacterized protein N7511_006627 [Penicillium nucicola]|uniref:uncharacterized protein n=1 Tax=Penicillium nucicola TaxID=1850975 RepID=UPI002545435F|nr:uncharacterized protein N7511_006627 [Penicillium nucicola]KAJ5757933.1 hypothetical protein N7511_006627 [Penicillium nucicola]
MADDLYSAKDAREINIENLEKRLHSLEAKSVNSTAQPSRISPRPNTSGPELEDRTNPAIEESALFQGGSSFATQSVQAREAIERASKNSPDDPSSLQESLSHLRGLLHSMPTNEAYSFRHSTSRSIPNMKLLPTSLVIGILQGFKTRRPIFLSSYAVTDLEFVENLCQKVYFPMASTSIGQVTSMHGILYYLLKEYMAIKDPLCHDFDFKANLEQCERNFIVGLETYDVMAVPSFENILALTMGAIKAQGEAKPFLYCNLLSAAAIHCKTLGYHRHSTYQKLTDRDAENVRRLFWTVYIFDKNNSLLLGRACQIQDSEVDTRYPSLPTDVGLRPWDQSFILGIKIASLQGQIYTALYSPVTVTKSLFERAQEIDGLSSALEEWHKELISIDASEVCHQQVFHLTRGNWDIMFYSTMTTLYRASKSSDPGADINSRCFQAARLSLKSHLCCFPQYQEADLLSDADYVNWVLLFSSFTPFIVTFFHAVAANNPEDLQLLDDVVNTLKNFREASQASRRLYQICSTFAQVAKKLSKSENSVLGIYNPHDDSLQQADSNGHPSFQADIFQEALDPGFEGYLSPSGAYDILDGWMARQPLSLNMFDMSSGGLMMEDGM